MATLPVIEKLATGAGYTVEQVKAVPGLSNRTLEISNRATEIGSVAISQASTFLKRAMKDPVTFVKNGLYLDILNGAKINSYDGYNTAISYLKNNGVSQDEIKSLTLSTINTINKDLQETQSKPSWFDQTIQVGTGIALTFMLPQLGNSLGASLLSSGVLAAGTTAATATAIGTAMASIAVQTAQGVPLEDAIKNAGVNLIVQTGATSAATQLNDVIKNPAVTDALVNAGASAIRTAAAGGSTEDIQKNVLGAIAGSATTSATGDNIAGSTVSGAVTGGVAGALSGAASALGQEEATKPKDTTTTKTDTTKTADATKLDPTTQSLVDAIKAEQASPTPSTELGKVAQAPMTGGVVAIDPKDDQGPGPKIDLPKVGLSSTPVQVIPPIPSSTDTLEPIVVTATQSGTPSLSDTKGDILETITTPKTTTPFTPPVTGTYTPTITTTPSPVITPTKTPAPVSPDKPILDLISNPIPAPTPTPVPAPVTPVPVTPTVPKPVTPLPITPAPVTPTPVTPPVTTPVPVTKPVTPLVTTPVTPTPVSPDKPILDLISSTKPTTPVAPVAPVTPTPVPVTPAPVPVTPAPKPVTPATPPEPAKPPVTPSVTPVSVVPTTPETVGSTAATPIDKPPAPPSGSPVVSEQDQRMLDLISPPPAPTTEPDQTLPEVVETATPDKETTPTVTDTKTEEPTPVDAGEEELPPEEVETEATTPTDKYKPKLFIYGGTTPSTLSQSLGTGGTYSTGVATTGLTGSRGAGEIESKETGKKRRTVWNEESLRLKDALGL